MTLKRQNEQDATKHLLLKQWFWRQCHESANQLRSLATDGQEGRSNVSDRLAIATVAEYFSLSGNRQLVIKRWDTYTGAHKSDKTLLSSWTFGFAFRSCRGHPGATSFGYV